jgi:serine/threonine-protein kinase RsbW
MAEIVKAHATEHIISTSKRYSLSVLGDVERLAEISEFIDRAARACGLNEDQSYDVQVAVDEACTNVINHAYRGRKDGRIAVTCEKKSSEFIVTIQDWGKRFDPKLVATPKTGDPLNRRKIGGLGLFFMQKMMDRVHFSSSQDHSNILVMVKKIKK